MKEHNQPETAGSIGTPGPPPPGALAPPEAPPATQAPDVLSHETAAPEPAAEAMTVKLPGVGRFVHFYRGDDPNAKRLSAVVAGENPDGTYNLTVFDFNGNTMPAQRVQFVATAEIPEHPCAPRCFWPNRD